ncbi:MAG: SulP family inorganic anion transporter [Bryobacteraceae bacterium]|nr:SulP family inorganic anion transporter [Bryobacteraceae bacterium]
MSERRGTPFQLADFVASIVVFLVALPLCLGIAIASGVPPALGLVAGIIGGLVVGALAGSPLQVSGPAAGLVVLVWELIQNFGLATLGVVVLCAGLIQVAGGLLGIGRWFRAVSPAVVNGMLAGIGILILASQFHVMVDDSPRASGILNLLSIPEAIYKGIFPVDGSSHHIAAVVGIITIVSLLMWNRYKPERLKLIPGALVGVSIATGIAAVMQLPIRYVDLPEKLWESVEFTPVASFAVLANPAVIVAVIGMAFVASAESLLCAVAVDRLHTGPRTNFDRELFAQGVGNTLCGALGALPLTGVIVRSSANLQAGAKTRMSAILHGLWLLILVVTLPFVLERIPIAALAAILVHTGYKLVNVENAKQVKRYGWLPFLIYLVTIAVIVSVDLLTGIMAGIVLSIAKLVFKVTRLWIRVEPGEGNRVDVYIEGAATFLKLPTLAHALERIPNGSDVHLHVQRLLYIDHSCMDLLRSWEKQQAEYGTKLIVEWSELNRRYHAPMSLTRVA